MRLKQQLKRIGEKEGWEEIFDLPKLRKFILGKVFHAAMLCLGDAPAQHGTVGSSVSPSFLTQNELKSHC